MVLVSGKFLDMHREGLIVSIQVNKQYIGQEFNLQELKSEFPNLEFSHLSRKGNQVWTSLDESCIEYSYGYGSEYDYYTSFAMFVVDPVTGLIMDFVSE